MDVFEKAKRSDIMRRVKSENNRSTEQKLIRFFKENGIKGWRRNYPVIGKPDFVFLQKRIAIFTDGCFWHGHDCRNTRPSDTREYWDKKRERNIRRDKEITALFQDRGWRVIRIWECEFKKKNAERLRERLAPLLEMADEFVS